VLEAVRLKDMPVKASSNPNSKRTLGLTIVDDIKPHQIFSAPVNDIGESVNVLYIDIGRVCFLIAGVIVQCVPVLSR
jgi:hypothetical protein